MKALAIIGGGTLVLALAMLLGPAAFAGKPRDEAMSRAALRGVNFVENCAYTHQAMDDPIVFPGKSGASHLHTFVGNVTTDASSSFNSMVGRGTTCRRAADTAGYWVPALYQGSTEILPVAATVYYRRATLASVSPFPNDFRMIAGSALATAPQGVNVTYWNCGVAAGVRPSTEVPTCPAQRGSFLRLHIRFPSCWDGRHIDSTDHKSHVAYAVAGRCPAGYPVALPAIEQIYRYPTLGGEGFSLASGGMYSVHADFLNAWKPGALRKLVNECLNALVHCGQGL